MLHCRFKRRQAIGRGGNVGNLYPCMDGVSYCSPAWLLPRLLKGAFGSWCQWVFRSGNFLCVHQELCMPCWLYSASWKATLIFCVLAQSYCHQQKILKKQKTKHKHTHTDTNKTKQILSTLEEHAVSQKTATWNFYIEIQYAQLHCDC